MRGWRKITPGAVKGKGPGLNLFDDLTPGLSGHDPARSFLFEHEELVAAEILTTPETAAIVAARRP